MKALIRPTPKILILCAACIVPATVLAGPPYDTDDPEPVEFMHWEAYIATQYLHGQEGVSGTEPHLEFNFGAAPNLQLHIIAPLAYSEPSGGQRKYGYGDSELGFKYRLAQETAKRPMIGIFPLVELPTGSSSKGLGNGQAQFFVPVWIQKSFAAWSSYGGGGYWHNPGVGNRDYWFFGWQAQKQVTRQCSVGGEIFHSTPSVVDGPDHTGFNLGTVYDFDESHHLLFSLGKDFRGPNVATAYVAFQWTFGPHGSGAPPSKESKKKEGKLFQASPLIG